jgi:hypothetical protein
MGMTIAAGTTVAIPTAYSIARNVTAATNATEAVLSIGSTTGIAIGDYVEITTSGWSRLEGRVFRVKALVANVSVTLEGVDTSSTALYPAGLGVGTLRGLSAWVPVTQIAGNIAISGGDVQYADATFLSDLEQRQVPTLRSASTITLPTFYDPALAWVATVRNVSALGAPAAFLFTFPNGSKLVGNAYWNLREVPTVQDNILRSEVTLAVSGRPVTYAT